MGLRHSDVGLLQQSIYCFTQAVKRDKNDVDSMWDRAVLLKLSGSIKQAIKAFTGILQIHPHDPGVLRELTPLLASTNAHARALTLLLDAYNFTRTSFPDPTEDDIAAFGPSDLESLADFLCQQKKFKECVRVVKEGVRWIQGRAAEKGWDKVGDDREFDEERKVRENWEEEAKYLEEAPVHELDVRLRLRLGVARMALNDVEEAQVSSTICCMIRPPRLIRMLFVVRSGTLRSSCASRLPSSPRCMALLPTRTPLAECGPRRWTCIRTWQRTRTPTARLCGSRWLSVTKS